MAITLNGTTGIAGVDGSAGTPAVQGGDSNTGIFFPAADTVAVTTGGSERVTVDSAGNVGIGTVSPTSRIQANNTINTVYGSSNTLASGAIAYIRNDSITNATAATLRFDAVGSASVAAASISAVHTGDAASALTIGTRANNGSDVTERARIDSSGNLLVGTTSSSGRLTVVRSENATTCHLQNTNASPDGTNTLIDAFYSPATPNNTTTRFFIGRDGSAVRSELRSNGGLANFSANNVNLSDERVKTNITPLGSYWDKIKALEVVTYKYRDQSHEDNNIGVIAQQVESVAPEFISNDGFGETPEDGVPLKSVYEADLHYATLKALQEAMARIETLEARITALEATQ